MDRGGHGVKVIRVNMGACAPGVTAERDNRSESTVPRGTSGVLLTHMSKGGSGKDVRAKVGVDAIPVLAGNLVELPC